MAPPSAQPDPSSRSGRGEAAGERSASVKTLVVTDLVDSTRLFAELGDLRAGRLSVRHERMARDLLIECRGREIDKTDGFLLLFDRAVDAVRFALGYHRSLAELSKSEGVELAARVGIHLGEVYERHNPPGDVARGAKPVEIEGVAKPLAARVMALAEGRQTLLTRAAFDLARQGAASERFDFDGDVDGSLRWLAHGPYRLKGVDEPVEIFEVGVTGFAPLLVPKSTAKAKRAVSTDDELTLGWRPAPGLEVPRRPGWIVVERLGEGGFGEVWLGKHAKTGEKRVFKFCYQIERLRSLQREVTLFRLLKESLGARDDIARIVEWNFEKAPYFLESEYTQGGNLLEWVAEQGGVENVPAATRLELIAQVAGALAAAHSVGVLHKDVKPSNVLITTGSDGEPSVRLTDFGIGLVTDRNALADRGITIFDLTEMVADGTTTPGGTHLYMAPEVVEGRTPTVQADVYALGVMLYQFLVGDFSRSLAPGWRRDLDDEILCEDVAAMVDGHPERRLRDAREVADRLRTLEQRRLEREAERRERAQREAERRALERAQRRRKASAVIAAAALVVLAVVSVLAYQAIEARKDAERRRAQAENLIGFMVGDLREKLEPIGRLDVLDDVGDQALEYFEAVPAEDLTHDEIYRRSQALYQIGEVRASQGNLAAALEAYRESLELAEVLVENGPDETRWLKALGTSHFGVGYVHWRQSLLDGAEHHFREYLAIAKTLAAKDPTNPEWQLELAYTHSNIGSVLQARRNLDGALEELQKTLEIKKRLVERFPDSSKYRLELAKSYSIAASALRLSGRLREAFEYAEEDLSIKTRLIEETPGDSQLRHRLAVSHNQVSSLAESLGRLDAARTHALKALDIMTRLVELDAANLRWRRELAIDHLRLASVLECSDQPARGLEESRRALEILESLTAEDPRDVLWQIDHADALRWTGVMSLLNGQPQRARERLATAEEVLRRATEKDSFEGRARGLLGIVHLHLGLSESASQDLDAARESWRRAVEILEPLAAETQDPFVLAPWVRAMVLLGRTSEAETATRNLWRLGFRRPSFVSFCREHALPVPEARQSSRETGPFDDRRRESRKERA